MADADLSEKYYGYIKKFAEKYCVGIPDQTQNIVVHDSDEKEIFFVNHGIIFCDTIHLCSAFASDNINDRLLEYAAIISILPKKIRLSADIRDIIFTFYFIREHNLIFQMWVAAITRHIVQKLNFPLLPGYTLNETLAFLQGVEFDVFLRDFVFQLPLNFMENVAADLVQFVQSESLKSLTVCDIKKDVVSENLMKNTSAIICNYGAFGLTINHTYLRLNGSKRNAISYLNVLSQIPFIRNIMQMDNITYLYVALREEFISEWISFLEFLKAENIIIDFISCPIKEIQDIMHLAKTRESMKMDLLIPFSSVFHQKILKSSQKIEPSDSEVYLSINFKKEIDIPNRRKNLSPFTPIFSFGIKYFFGKFSKEMLDDSARKILKTIEKGKIIHTPLQDPANLKLIEEKSHKLAEYYRQNPLSEPFLQKDIETAIESQLLFVTKEILAIALLLPENIRFVFVLPTDIEPGLLRHIFLVRKFSLLHNQAFFLITKVKWADFLFELLLRYYPVAINSESEYPYVGRNHNLGLYWHENQWITEIWDMEHLKSKFAHDTGSLSLNPVQPPIPLRNKPHLHYKESEFIKKLVLNNRFHQLSELFKVSKVRSVFLKNALKSIRDAYVRHLYPDLNKLKCLERSKREHTVILDSVFSGEEIDTTQFRKAVLIIENVRFSTNPYLLMENYPLSGLFNPYLRRIWHIGGDMGITVLEYLIPHSIASNKNSHFNRYLALLKDKFGLTFELHLIDREIRLWNSAMLESDVHKRFDGLKDVPSGWSFDNIEKSIIDYTAPPLHSPEMAKLELFFLNNKIWRLLNCSFILMVKIHLGADKKIPDAFLYHIARLPGSFLYTYANTAMCFLYVKSYPIIFYTQTVIRLQQLKLDYDTYHIFDLSSHLDSIFEKITTNPIIRSLEGGVHEWPIFTGKSSTELYSYREFEIFKQALTSQNIQECTTKQWNAFMREGRNLMKANNFTLNAVTNAIKSIFLENTINNNKDTS